MDNLIKRFFSMRMMALGMLFFLLAIAAATFLESAYDIQTARILVYNSLWFEILLAFLGINLIANIFEHRMFRREKIAVLAFHLSFIVILIGSWVTRYVSFDGLMLIREGTESNFIYSSDPYLWFDIDNGKEHRAYSSNKLLMSEITDNHFSLEVEFRGHKAPITIEYVNFQKKMIDTLIIHDSIEEKSLDIVTDGMKSHYLSKKGFLMVGNTAISYEKTDAMPGIQVAMRQGQMMMKSVIPVKYLPMTEMAKAREAGGEVDPSLYVEIPVDSWVPFKIKTLYVVGQDQFVFKQLIDHAKNMKVSSGRKDVGVDYLTVKVSDGTATEIVALAGGMGAMPRHEVFSLNGLVFQMEYGPKQIQLPFAVACRDFQLDKYPGSESASSFASEVTVIDRKNKHTHDQRIFMNNVMDYRGYRFFQSSYDLDDPTTPENEEGTRLSVNSDWWGTNITYVGYLLMAIGMLFSLFSPYSRFKELNAKLKKTRERREALNTLLLILVLSFSGATVAQEHHDSDGHEHHHDGHEHHHEPVKKAVFRVMSEEHAEHFESLMVQDFDGRIIPMHTSCDQLLRKMYRGNKFKKWNAVQTIMSMHMYPQHWMKVPVVQVAANLRDTLKLKEFASFKDLADEQGEFRWMKEYNEAHHKLEAKRNEFDKKLLKLLDKFQVAKSIFSWRYMKWIPSKGDKNNTWFVPLSMDLMKMDSTSSNFALRYLKKLDDACKSNQFGEVDDLLSEWKAFQIKEGAGVIPSESKIKVEISYNKMNIFKNTWHTYMGVGFLLLILFFVRIFVKTSGIIEKSFKVMSKVFVGLLVIMFLYHGMGLGFRWYITGYAPWSNGYGAIVFIAWVTMIAGFLFSRKNPVIIAGTAILAALMIFVSEMNLMDPEITPIQPVLKSYWLMIHVSIITGSYGFLGLGCILSLLCLILYIARTERNGKVITLHITELSYVTEMIITVGLFMLTIGTFLGGIWANESWGRYWAWDPKEVWALVSVLVYAIILHLRYIPGLASKFTFNVVTFWAYSAILFTFFGVNFYLVGLHSYAQGDGLGSVPAGIIISAIVFMLLTIWAGYRNKIYTQSFQAKTWGRIVFDFLLIRTVLVYALSLITVDSHPFWPTTFYWLAIFNGALFVFHVVFKRITKEANILKP